jgi:DNA-binding response OmpR family regulator
VAQAETLWTVKVLLVEDDERTAQFITSGLREAGFTVERAADGRAGLRRALAEPFDVAVVDLMLPGLDGLSLIGELRRRRLTMPILILSAKASVDDRVRGLELGGDDYLVKPFAFSELLARVQALLRRASATAEPTTLTVGELVVDLLRRRAVRSGIEIELQPREFALLEYLMRHAGRVVSKTMIMEHVWEYNFDPQTNVVEARVCRLREKLDRPFARPLIRTIRGVGYVLEDRA